MSENLTLGSTGNQARLNNGCVCQDGCPACDALAERFERLERELNDWRAMPLSKRLAHETERADDCEKRLERLAESWEAMRTALAEVCGDKVPWHVNANSAEQRYSFSLDKCRAALALAAKVKA